MRALCLVALAGCSRVVEPDPGLLPPPDLETIEEHVGPGGFDPCPSIEVDEPVALSASAVGTGDPRIGWNQDTRRFAVLWRDGDDVVFRFVDEDGRTVGLEGSLRAADDPPAVGGPAVVGVPGLANAGFYVTIQTSGRLEVARLFANGTLVREDAVLGGPLDSATPAMAWDGENLAIGYALDTGDSRLVSYEKLGDDALDCGASTEGGPEDHCADDASIQGARPSVGFLDGRWMMAVSAGSGLSWIALDPAGEDGGTAQVETIRLELDEPAAGSAARVASAERRLAVALRTGQGTRVWQVSAPSTGEGEVQCVLEARELTAGTPAVVWGHGRRVAVAGLWPRPNGGRHVVIARADAPVVSSDCEGLELEIDPVQVSRGSRSFARDPDMVFSGSAFGIVWAEHDIETADGEEGDEPANVYFALARCSS